MNPNARIADVAAYLDDLRRRAREVGVASATANAQAQTLAGYLQVPITQRMGRTFHDGKFRITPDEMDELLAESPAVATDSHFMGVEVVVAAPETIAAERAASRRVEAAAVVRELKQVIGERRA